MAQSILETTVFYLQASLFALVMILTCVILFKKVQEVFKKS